MFFVKYLKLGGIIYWPIQTSVLEPFDHIRWWGRTVKSRYRHRGVSAPMHALKKKVFIQKPFSYNWNIVNAAKVGESNAPLGALIKTQRKQKLQRSIVRRSLLQ